MSSKNKITLDDIKDISVAIVERMVLDGLIKDCIDTDDPDEFDVQDIVVDVLCDKLGIENE